MIEDAIPSCEIADCKTKPAKMSEDNLDKLKKLKALLDSGALTVAEYETEKKKILN